MKVYKLCPSKDVNKSGFKVLFESWKGLTIDKLSELKNINFHERFDTIGIAESGQSADYLECFSLTLR